MGTLEGGKAASAVEPQSREDAAERRRLSRAPEMGARVSVAGYATGTWHKGDAVGEAGGHHQPGVKSCPAAPGLQDPRASSSSGPSAGCHEVNGPGEGEEEVCWPFKRIISELAY